jgi:hypothetical protein
MREAMVTGEEAMHSRFGEGALSGEAPSGSSLSACCCLRMPNEDVISKELRRS